MGKAVQGVAGCGCGGFFRAWRTAQAITGRLAGSVIAPTAHSASEIGFRGIARVFSVEENDD